MNTLANNIEKLERLTKRERLGELLLRARVLNLAKLVELMNEYKFSLHGPFGEFIVDKNLITREKLLEFLNLQKIQDNVIDNCLQSLGYMTNEKKWETLTRQDKIGEILVKEGKISLKQLILSIEEQATNPEKLIGDILVEKNIITDDVLDNAIKTQRIQNSTILKTINEITDISQLPVRVKMNHMNARWGNEFIYN